MLNQQDINGLLSALTATDAAGEGGGSPLHEVKIYDFARPDNLPSEFVRALENINLTFARALSGMLTGFLTEGVQVDAFSAEQITFRHLCNEVPETTALCTFGIPPLEGTALFELNPHIAMYVLDRGLGGTGNVSEGPRDFTPLEKGLLEDLFRRILHELSRAWEALLPMRATLREVMNNALLARISHPEDRLVVCSFAVTLPTMTGMATYGIPINSLDFDRLLSVDHQWGEEDPAVRAALDEAALQSCVMEVPFPVRACLRNQQVTLGWLAALREGDVLELEALVDDPIEVRIGNRRYFQGRPLRTGEKVAIELTTDWMEE